MTFCYSVMRSCVVCCCHLQGVSVEAVDPVFQAKMLDMLKQTGRYVEQVLSFESDVTSVCALIFLHSEQCEK